MNGPTPRTIWAVKIGTNWLFTTEYEVVGSMGIGVDLRGVGGGEYNQIHCRKFSNNKIF